MSDLYDDWIRYTFDRPELSNPWESDLGAVPFEAESIPAVMSELVVQTCLLSGEELTRFSDLQVATGLRYIFEPSCSDVVFTLMHPSLALDARVACIDSIFHLYEGCFQKRCPQTLVHNSEGAQNPLQAFCYMLWDITPLRHARNDPLRTPLNSAVIALLERVLQLPHQGCIESALHGLGHVYLNARDEVQAVTDRWLRTGPAVRPELLLYAAAARTGQVN